MSCLLPWAGWPTLHVVEDGSSAPVYSHLRSQGRPDVWAEEHGSFHLEIRISTEFWKDISQLRTVRPFSIRNTWGLSEKYCGRSGRVFSCPLPHTGPFCDSHTRMHTRHTYAHTHAHPCTQVHPPLAQVTDPRLSPPSGQAFRI